MDNRRFGWSKGDVKTIGSVDTVKEWNEDDHPRDERGRFGSTSGETNDGFDGNNELRDAVDNTVTEVLQERGEELRQDGLLSATGSIEHERSVAAKVTVMEDLAERMSDVPVEQVASLVTDISRVYERDETLAGQFTKMSEEEIVAAVQDETLMFVREDGVLYALQNSDPQSGIQSVTAEEKETALREHMVQNLVHNWALSSNDHNPVSLAVQTVAERQFGLENTATWDTPSHISIEVYEVVDAHAEVLASFVQAQYDSTQEYLAKEDIDNITLVRGMELQSGPDDPPLFIGPDVQIEMRPLSSWTTDPDIATQFGSYNLESTFPAAAIFSLPVTGNGCLSEAEVVVLGGVTNANITEMGDMGDPS